MIKSMTAFAGTDLSTDDFSVTVEIRGYNSRHLDVAIRMPSAFGALEEKIRQVVAKRLTRGRVEIKVIIMPVTENSEAFDVNERMAKAYYAALVQLKNKIDPDMDIPLSLLAEKTGIIEPAEREINPNTAWQAVHECLMQALSDFDAMKTNEGAAIADDLKQRLGFIGDCISRIEDKTKNLLIHYQDRLKERINDLTRGIVALDPGRIAQEAAFLADKSDISEEIIRATSHLKQFRDLMRSDSPAGRPLNFLVQEFNREFNTMGSKVCDVAVSHLIVSAKTEIEKIREQIQNVE